jgi:two-component system chemotaxis response regulator CheY
MNVLIVDDSKAMRCIIARALREMGVPGSPYLEAANGKAALRTIAESDPEFVISDLNMPEMSGMELLQELRKDGNTIPFGFVTSEASAQLREEASAAGATFVVTKPFTAANLSQTLGPLLDKLGCCTRSVDSDMAQASLGNGDKFPTPPQIASVLSGLLRRNASAVSQPAAPLLPHTRIVAEYHSSEDGSLAACAVCDLAFAVRAGAALTLIPPGVSEEAIRGRVLEDTVADNFQEVVNVMARFFDRGGHSRVRLGTVHLPGAKLGVELAVQIAKPAARVDLAIDIAGYGKGGLALLSFRKAGQVGR